MLRLPALADVEQPATGHFVDVFAEANALRTDEFPGPDYARRFVEAVEHAEQGWAAAVEAAERKRDTRFDPALAAGHHPGAHAARHRRLVELRDRSAGLRTSRPSGGSPSWSGAAGGWCRQRRPWPWNTGHAALLAAAGADG